MAALILLPIEASDAGWLSDLFKGSPKPVKSPKQTTSAKRATVASVRPRRSLLARRSLPPRQGSGT